MAAGEVLALLRAQPLFSEVVALVVLEAVKKPMVTEPQTALEIALEKFNKTVRNACIASQLNSPCSIGFFKFYSAKC